MAWDTIRFLRPCTPYTGRAGLALPGRQRAPHVYKVNFYAEIALGGIAADRAPGKHYPALRP